MEGTKLYIVWKNAKGDYVLSVRKGVNHDAVSYANSASEGTIVSTPSTLSIPSTFTFAASFWRPLSIADDANDITITSAIPYIWALGLSAPSNPDSISGAVFEEHRGEGSFKADLLGSTPVSNTPTPTNTTTGTTSNYCYNTDAFCVSSILDPATNIVTFVVSSTSTGWVGLGVGSNMMAGATMYIAYKNSTGGYTLSQRSAGGHVDPTLTSSQDFNLVSIPSSVTVPSTAKIAFAFTRPANSAGAASVSTTGTTNFIWAVSGSSPSNVNSASAGIRQHDDFGAFALNLQSGGQGYSIATGELAMLYKKLHGISMFLAWAVFPWVGVFTARYLKDALGHNWYRIHVGTMVGGALLFSALGMLFIELEISGPRFTTQDSHRILGIVVAFALLPAQIILGYVINALFNPERTSVPWHDQLHQWVGRGSVILAAVTIHLGLVLYSAPSGYIVAFWVWQGLMLIVMVAGQFKFGQVNHMKKSDNHNMVPLTKA
ncbi:hypothetical protein HDU76_008055 [Blyttiomyces sp. JEL0837]|nr:hypothetical protein HDU76_008055 [Blyttiomyces sp. JEL0837]